MFTPYEVCGTGFDILRICGEDVEVRHDFPLNYATIEQALGAASFVSSKTPGVRYTVSSPIGWKDGMKVEAVYLDGIPVRGECPRLIGFHSPVESA